MQKAGRYVCPWKRLEVTFRGAASDSLPEPFCTQLARAASYPIVVGMTFFGLMLVLIWGELCIMLHA